MCLMAFLFIIAIQVNIIVRVEFLTFSKDLFTNNHIPIEKEKKTEFNTIASVIQIICRI